MQRTYPREVTLTDIQQALVDRIRDRIGDSILFIQEYLSASDSATSSKIIAGGLTYHNSDYKFWPFHLTVDGTTYSGATITSGTNSGTRDPQVMRYQYLVFTTVAGNTLVGKVLDFGLEAFKLSDQEIWNVYNNVDLTGLVQNDDCITEYMKFLKACLDLCKILRTRRYHDDFMEKKVRDSDTEYSRSPGRSSADPYKDLYRNIEDELQRLIDNCNKGGAALYWGGIRVE